MLSHKERARWCRWVVRQWNKYPMITFWDFIGDSSDIRAYRSFKYDGYCLKTDFAEAFIVACRRKRGLSKSDARYKLYGAISHFLWR